MNAKLIHRQNVRLKRVATARDDARKLRVGIIQRIQGRDWPPRVKAEMRQLVLDELITELSLNWLAHNPKKARCPDWRNGQETGRMKASNSTKKQ